MWRHINECADIWYCAADVGVEFGGGSGFGFGLVWFGVLGVLCSVLPGPVLSGPVLHCYVLFVLSCAAMSCPVLPCVATVVLSSISNAVGSKSATDCQTPIFTLFYFYRIKRYKHHIGLC